MTRRSRIAVVGSANVDLTTFSDRFPKAGETIFGEHFDLGWGGKGANQAVAARLCGAEVSMVARVGDDLFGPGDDRELPVAGHRRLARARSCRARRAAWRRSSSSRTARTGSSSSRAPTTGCCRPTSTRRTPCSRPPTASCCSSRSRSRPCIHTVRFARQRGIRCIVNPAPAQPVDLAALAGVDYFVPNETEAETITGMPVRSVDDASGLRHAPGGAGAAARHHHAGREGRAGRRTRAVSTLDRRRTASPRRTRPAPATRSSAASPCSSAKGWPSATPSRARTSTRRCRRPASARRSRSSRASGSTRSGQRARPWSHPDRDPRHDSDRVTSRARC